MAEMCSERFAGPLPGFDRDQKIGDIVEFHEPTPLIPLPPEGKWRIVEVFDDDSAIYERVEETAAA